MTVNAEFVGFSEAALKFSAAGAGARDLVQDAVTRLTLRLMTISVDQKLSGQVLKRRTGTLARSVTQSPRTYVSGATVVGTVGTGNLTGPGGRAPVKYGRAHEFGFSGTVNVREHMRQVKKVFGRELAAPVTATVRAHPMQMRLPERSFLRSSLRDLVQSGAVQQEFGQAAKEMLK